MPAIANLALSLSASTDGLSADLRKAMGMVDGYGDSVRKSFKRQAADIGRMRLETSPFNLRQQAGLNLAQGSAQRQYDRGLGLETARQGIGGGLGGIGKGIGQLASGDLLKGFSTAAEGAMGLTEGIEGLSAALAPETFGISLIVGGVVAAGGALAQFGQQMLALAGITNPFLLQRYNDAWQDLYGVLGRMFVPVLDLATVGVRTLADFLATILPTTQDVAPFFSMLKQTFADMVPLLAGLAQVIKAFLVPAIQGLLLVINAMVKQFRDQVLAFAYLTGNSDLLKSLATLGVMAPMASSMGAAARGASYVAGEDVSKNAIAATYGAGDLQVEIRDILRQQLELARLANVNQKARDANNKGQQGF